MKFRGTLGAVSKESYILVLRWYKTNLPSLGGRAVNARNKSDNEGTNGENSFTYAQPVGMRSQSPQSDQTHQ